MSEQPYIENGWLCEPCEPEYVPGVSLPIPGSESVPLVNLRELGGYDAEIAAAEQRGRVAALREAAEAQDIIHHMYRYFDNHPVNSPAAVRATARYLHHRADQIQGDDDD